MAETALAFALKKAGVNTDAALARQIAVAELRKAERNPQGALAAFIEELKDAGGLMAQVVSEASLRRDALTYLERVAADMRGEGLKVPAKAGDGVRQSHEDRPIIGPVENSEGEGSVKPVVIHEIGGPSPSDTVPSKDGGGVHGVTENHVRSGSPENREGEAVLGKVDCLKAHGPSSSHQVRNGAVQEIDEGRKVFGRVVPIPNKPRGLDVMKGQAKFNSAYDSYLTRDGIPIGDVVFSTIHRIESANAREAALLRLIREHVSPIGDPNARVRDLIKLEDLQRMIQKAAEIAQ